MNMAPEAAWMDTAAMDKSVLRLSMGFFHRSMKLALVASSFSARMAVWISSSSSCTASLCGRIHSSDLRACSFLSMRSSQRGDSGMKKRPMDRKKGMM